MIVLSLFLARRKGKSEPFLQTNIIFLRLKGAISSRCYWFAYLFRGPNRPVLDRKFRQIPRLQPCLHKLIQLIFEMEISFAYVNDALLKISKGLSALDEMQVIENRGKLTPNLI